MKRDFFIHKEHQDFFEENGYVKINYSFLNNYDIENLVTFFNDSGLLEYTDNALYMAMENPQKESIKLMVQKIKDTILPKLEYLIIDPVFIFGSFILKYPNPKVTTLAHQDGTFIEDEKENNSITCWIPLTDVDIHNGCIGVIPKSNKIYDSIRPLPSPQVYRPLDKHVFSLIPYFKLIPMKAGEVLFFDNKIFHNSPPNLTNGNRMAISSWLTQKNTSLRLYYLEPGTKNTLMKYEIDDKFYLKYDNTILSKMYNEGKVINDYPLICKQEYEYKDYSIKKMIQKVEKMENIKNIEFENHMRKYFPIEMKKSLFDKILNLF